MAERGIDITSLRSRQVTPAMALAADLILVMDRDQKEWCESMAPSIRGRVYLLGCWLAPDKEEIPDPNRKDRKVFSLAFELIDQSVAAWRDHLKTPRRIQ